MHFDYGKPCYADQLHYVVRKEKRVRSEDDDDCDDSGVDDGQGVNGPLQN